MARKETPLLEIHPTDMPRSENWKRAVQYLPDDTCFVKPVDLDRLEIVICHATDERLGPIEGNHRLARILQLVGNINVIFTLIPSDNDDPNAIDELIQDTEEIDKIPNFDVFLAMCLANNFPDDHKFGSRAAPE